MLRADEGKAVSLASPLRKSGTLGGALKMASWVGFVLGGERWMQRDFSFKLTTQSFSDMVM